MIGIKYNTLDNDVFFFPSRNVSDHCDSKCTLLRAALIVSTTFILSVKKVFSVLRFVRSFSLPVQFLLVLFRMFFFFRYLQLVPKTNIPR